MEINFKKINDNLLNKKFPIRFFVNLQRKVYLLKLSNWGHGFEPVWGQIFFTDLKLC